MTLSALDARTRHLASQVLYQIFPDRFAIGHGLSPQEKLLHDAYKLPHAVPGIWGEPPQRTLGAQQFYGGDLDGITEQLDYIAGLGITGIYLTPIFCAPSNHKYDSSDFFNVDPMFGGNAALQRLIAALHAQGMHLTLDAVLNHVSDHHPWFVAAQSGDMGKRDWFSFAEDGSYQCWQDHHRLPELNLSNPQVRDALYRSPDSLVQHWLAHGVDNWRFDVAQDVGLEVSRDVARVVAQRFPNANLWGELTGFAGAWLKGPGGTFHGMMNYWHRTAILGWLGGGIGTRQVHHALRDAREGYSLAGLLRSWNMLSSHDTARLATVLPPAQARLAQLMQCTLPGIPLIYYGDEIGLEGGEDPDCRRTMPREAFVGAMDSPKWLQQLIALRQSHPALQWGDIQILGDRLDTQAVIYLRHTDVIGEAALVVVNSGAEPLRARLMLPYSHWYDGLPLRDALGWGQDTKMQAGSVELHVPPHSGAVFVPTNTYKNYAFFKPRNRG